MSNPLQAVQVVSVLLLLCSIQPQLVQNLILTFHVGSGRQLLFGAVLQNSGGIIHIISAERLAPLLSRPVSAESDPALRRVRAPERLTDWRRWKANPARGGDTAGGNQYAGDRRAAQNIKFRCIQGNHQAMPASVVSPLAHAVI